MTQVFLTGGSGFIGGALCSQLVEDGQAVRALARSREAAERVAARDAEPWDGHVLDEDRLAAGMAGCAIAYHVAGVNTHCPDDAAHLMHVNVVGTQAVVRAAARAGVRRVVMTSSAASIGERHGTVGDEDTAHRGSYLSVYDRSKHEAEMAAFAAGERLGVEIVTLNPSSVQGPGRASGNGKLIIDYLNGKLPAFVDVPVSIVDVADVAEAHRLAAERGRPGRAAGAALRAQRRDRPVTGGTGARRGALRRSRAGATRAAGARPRRRHGGRGRGPRPRPHELALPGADPHHPARAPLRRLAGGP
jgi:dihydroflavonol-4-reductase